jgi:hypothetical protein
MTKLCVSFDRGFGICIVLNFMAPDAWKIAGTICRCWDNLKNDLRDNVISGSSAFKDADGSHGCHDAGPGIMDWHFRRPGCAIFLHRCLVCKPLHSSHTLGLIGLGLIAFEVRQSYHLRSTASASSAHHCSSPVDKFGLLRASKVLAVGVEATDASLHTVPLVISRCQSPTINHE